MANSFNPNDNFGPDGKGGYGAPLEDLSIIVNLTAERKPKTIINSGSGAKNTPIGSIQIPDGSSIGGEKWLSTNYTQLNTVFNKSGANVEGLGINSVNIEFNSSYTPMISISMTDVRGSSVFAAGNDSNYSIFFDLPYPIFSLEVKGHYGQAVRYCLHLLKFTTKFNSQTGNFDINCEFIGYTYAFLTDMLIGYLRANVYTSQGETEFDKYKTNFESKYHFDLPTIDNYFDQVNLLGTVLKKVRQDSYSGKLLVNVNERLRLLDIIEESIKVDNKNLMGDYPSPQIVDTTVSMLIVTGNDRIIKKDHQTSIADTGRLIQQYNEVELDGSFDITSETKKKLKFHTSRRITNRYYITKAGYEELNFDAWDKTASTAIKKSNIPTFMFYQYVFDDLDSLRSKLYVKRGELNDVLGKELAIQSNRELGFTATIERLVAILSAHVDIFINTIKSVSSDAEKQDYKRLSKTNVLDTYKGKIYPWPGYFESKIDKSGDQNNYDTWLGRVMPQSVEVKYIEDLLNKLIMVAKHDQELAIEFQSNDSEWYPINPLELQDGMENPYQAETIKTSSHEDVLKLISDRLFSLNIGNYNLLKNELKMVATIEARSLFNGLIKKSEWSFIKGLRLKLKDITKYLLSDDFCKKTDYMKKSTQSNGVEIYVLNDVYKTPLVNNLVSVCGLPTDDVLEPPMLSIGKQVTPVDPTNWDWRNSSNYDLPGKYTALIDTGEFLYKTFPDYDDIFTSYNIKEQPITTSILFPKQTNSVIKNTGYSVMNPMNGCQVFEYMTNANGEPVSVLGNFYFDKNVVLGNNRNTPTVNGTYENFDKNKAKNFGVPFHDMGGLSGDIALGKGAKKHWYLDSPYVKYRPLINNPNLKEIVLDATKGGEWNSSNFYMPFMDYFLTDNPDYYNPNSSESFSIGVSLFGSDLYWSQKSEKAKAFLFLNTLQMVQDVDYLNKGIFTSNNVMSLFSERAGAITVPYPWILFMGGILWRLMSGSEPLNWKSKSSTVTSTLSPVYAIPISDTAEIDDFPKKDDYLMDQMEGSPSDMNGGIEKVTSGIDSMKFVNYGSVTKSIKHIKLEETILNLPKQTKDMFINEFTNWVDNDGSNIGWKALSGELSIFEPGTTYGEFISVWDSYPIPSSGTSMTELRNWVDNNPFNKDVYDTITVLDVKEFNSSNAVEKNSSYNYYTRLSSGTTIQSDLYDFVVNRDKILLNGSTLIWNHNRISGNRHYQKDLIGRNNYISISQIGRVDYKVYMDAFHEEYNKLVTDYQKTVSKTDEAVIDSLFGDLNNESIKLSLYRSIKSIYEKWVAGANQNNNCVLGDKDLIDSFRFIDRDFTPIGDQFLVNPTIMQKNIMGDMNQNFYDVVTRMLSDNYFDFVSLPTYIDYKSEGVLKSVFKPYPYKSEVLQSISGPAFVCIYSGQKSIHLDMGPNAKYPNDGMVDGDSLKTGTPIFEVNYGDENQNYFKDISLDQEEFSETQESLKIIDDISLRGAEGNRGATGQNLFNIYNTRSYSCEIEMLGDAMIQPMMYFKLNNIPMFRGVYLIINVSHSITPNAMTTKFKGVRIRSTKTPLVDESTLYMSILGTNPTEYTGTAVRSGSDRDISTTQGMSRNNTTDAEMTATSGWVNPFLSTSNTTCDDLRVFSTVKLRNHKYHDGYDLSCNSANASDTTVVAVEDGTVEMIKYGESAGLWVQIKHKDPGTGLVFITVYMHLKHISTNLVKVYSDTSANLTTLDFMTKTTPRSSLLSSNNKSKKVLKIKKGEPIGLMGGGTGDKQHNFIYNKDGNDIVVNSGGRVSQGIHLHFEVWASSRHKARRDKYLRNPGLFLPGLRGNDTYNKRNAARDGYDEGYGE